MKSTIISGPLANVVVLSDQRAKRQTTFPTYVPPRIYEDDVAAIVGGLLGKKPNGGG